MERKVPFKDQEPRDRLEHAAEIELSLSYRRFREDPRVVLFQRPPGIFQ